ncbi:MAG: hypothetical protein RL695_483 [Pseudomonadota bacterium]|jgi:hypothetical protein
MNVRLQVTRSGHEECRNSVGSRFLPLQSRHCARTQNISFSL